MSYFAKSLSSLRTPTVPAKKPPDLSALTVIAGRGSVHSPLEISLVESSPPYEPSHPAMASMSTEIQQRASASVSICLHEQGYLESYFSEA